MDVEDGGGAAARMNVEEGLTKPVHSPSGVQKIYTARGASPPEGAAKTEPKVVKLFFNNVLSPERTQRKQNPYGVDLLFFAFYCGLEKGVWHYQFTGGNLPFWNLENVLSPEETLRKQNPKGTIWYSSILLWLKKDVWHF